MYRLFSNVIKYRKPILILFIAAAIAGAILRPFVAVNYDMKDYLPENTPSTEALETMKAEYKSGVPNARVMIKDVTIAQALDYKKQFFNIDGVTDVQWLDDSVVSINMPLSYVGRDLLDEYYKVDSIDDKRGDALISVTIQPDKTLKAVSKIREIVGDRGYLTGDAVSTAAATESTVVETKRITALSIIMVLIVMIFTTGSWAEPVLILIGIGIAIAINMGSNIIFGEISFVTNAAGSILQLAVSLDYSVFLIHRFEECRKSRALEVRQLTISQNEEAMIEALMKSSGSILSSGITTVIGFLALLLMQFRMGPDLGIALAKGILISIVTAFAFVPSLTLMCMTILDRTKHKSFLPDFSGFGRIICRIMIPAVCAFVLAIVPAFIFSNSNSYYYGSSNIFGTDYWVGQDTEKIDKEFGQQDTYALMVPKGDLVLQREMENALKELHGIVEIKSYGETLSDVIPDEIVPTNISGLLISEHYSRIAIVTDAGREGDKVFSLVRKIRLTASEYYGNDYLLAGNGVSTYDLKTTITADLLKVNIAAILAVLFVLIIMFRSVILSVILVAGIETAIWINLAIPCLLGDPVFYIAYLIISSIQLGATVDYAILMTDRYRENRRRFERKEAVIETIRQITPSILTSGSALTIVGLVMGFVITHRILAQLGMFIGRGALCSLLIVFFVLPGLLYIFDKWIIKNDSTNRLIEIRSATK